MTYVYLDDVYVYDNASSPEALQHFITAYSDRAKREGKQVKFVIEFDYREK